MKDAELKTELLARRSRLVAQQAKLAEQLRGLDAAIKALFNENEPELGIPSAVDVPKKGLNGNPRPLDIRTAVDMAIDQSPKELSVRDVLTWLQINHPTYAAQKDYVGNLFWSLAKSRGLAVVRKGKGRAPTIYLKP